MSLFFCKGLQEETRGLSPAALEGHGLRHCHNDNDLGKPMFLTNLDIKKVRFRVQGVGRGINQGPVRVMADGKEYGFTMNRKNADKAIAIYQAKLPALKVVSSLNGELMVTESENAESS